MARVLRTPISAAFKISERNCDHLPLSSSSSSTSSHGFSWCFEFKKNLHFRCYSALAAAEVVTGGIRGMPLQGGLRGGWDLLGAKEYLEYRRSLYGDITHRALLVDVAGTLLKPSQPVPQVYRQFGEKYGVQFSEDEILQRYRWAYEQPWGRSRLRYVDDGRPFWQFIVASSTGCSDSQYFEELYQYYTTDKAWHLCDPNAEKVFEALREAGVKVAVVSNFDTRLRPLLRALKCDHWFDGVAVSAEVAAEKPNPMIFMRACELLGVKPEDAVHVGDDRRNDVWGARDAGCDAWLWGSDVHSFKEVAERIGVEL
ncbi:haloacid dehalogenase-like hydrolase domain-containing protein 3 [Phalaenopsis equestris]|uniref:haloacid dehalogenase-like hydrolase domain-containing protein 3 n=1 Tax=Phalaenopsis equestris TaxID=78828 RepID=UPI0009E542F1|nr:haloacid dehalogenase-like hydrolase domain-containing protein 3 [Phalaenopsis equestris]XP_020584987.1 haloacid dehalogenase-like hydrolase domain-containing protein 3 [Phalaenopsis equestris]XP_020584989.1 haloacid dehalogenase-like hydrolase domain-containing protein 3 [Phalaenopsis equestris]XP_020595987.1 haloacid dehalogenase-like hydrolase domain-containing protein 3 [Phalaenopsis equestris]